jgi:hypothetical protein
MTVELDSGIRSLQKLDGENEDLTLILRKKWNLLQNAHFLLQNQQWNQRMNSHEPCI